MNAKKLVAGDAFIFLRSSLSPFPPVCEREMCMHMHAFFYIFILITPSKMGIKGPMQGFGYRLQYLDWHPTGISHNECQYNTSVCTNTWY